MILHRVYRFRVSETDSEAIVVGAVYRLDVTASKPTTELNG